MKQQQPYSLPDTRRPRAGWQLPAFFAAYLLCFLLGTTPSAAQADSKGTDFRFTFLPNYHDALFDNRDSLYIFIAVEQPTSGEILYSDRYGQVSKQAFSIADPTAMYTFAVPSLQFELEGFNNSGVIPSFNEQNEQVALQSFHITTDADATVYAMSRSYKSTDAFLVLPTDALGKHYAVLSYKSNGRSNGPILDGFSTPSQFVVVATENNTEVQITPSEPTWENGMEPQRVVLQAGECYLVQAGLTPLRLNTDLTGTRITSSKPVAVFSGHQRATIPAEQSDKLRTRNLLAEHLPPIETWGYRALATPYPIPYNETKTGNDLVRVLAFYDSTVVTINGVQTATLVGGTYYEQPLQQAAYIEATAPILVAQYKKTSRAEMESAGRSGDPFMMLIPPEEQFLPSYRFINPQVESKTPEPPFFKPIIFQEQYATVVVPRLHVPSLRLDGAPVTATFTDIPGTPWAYAHLAVSDGVHTVEAAVPIGLYVYGYGEADSYGYTGGMKAVLIPKDLTPPQLITRSVCTTAGGTVYDSTTSDSGIRSIEAPESLRVNVDVQLPVLQDFPPVASFSARLTDPYQDGRLRIVATDSARLHTERDIVIYGFTVSATVAGTGETLVEATTRIKREVCFDLELHNYGTTTHTLAATIADPRFSVATTQPIYIAPGEKQLLRVCFESDDADTFLDTLILSNDCAKRLALPFAIEAVNDTNRPQFAARLDTCTIRREGIVSEELSTDWGLQEVSGGLMVNATIEMDYSEFPRVVRYTATLVDESADGIVEIIAIDEAGNELHLRDTIPGRTLRPKLEHYQLPNLPPPAARYDSVEVYNVGLLPVEITSAHFRENVFFSVPFAQFPIVVPPQESRAIHIVFAPAAEQLYADTIDIRQLCGSLPISVSGRGHTPPRILSTGCDVRIALTTEPGAHHAQITGGYPNPADGTATLRMIVPARGTMAVRLYNELGAQAQEAEFTAEMPGVYDIVLDISDLDSGAYIAVVQTTGATLSYRLIIRH